MTDNLSAREVDLRIVFMLYGCVTALMRSPASP